MLNQVLLIGRLTQDPVIREIEGGKKVADIHLAVLRSFKNQEGIYETDFIPITLWQGLAETLGKYCVKGSMIAVKARLQIKKAMIQEKTIYLIEAIGERITFLSPSSEKNLSS